jgi:hypothetical protein
MDDHSNHSSAQLTVSRCCETSRLGGQLLAQAYQELFPRIRRSLADARSEASAMTRGIASAPITSTAARAAAGA